MPNRRPLAGPLGMSIALCFWLRVARAAVPVVHGTPAIVFDHAVPAAIGLWVVSLETAPSPESPSDDPVARHICDGVVYSSEWILTAAHCVEGRQVGDIVVHTGAANIRYAPEYRTVAEIIIYPGHYNTYYKKPIQSGGAVKFAKADFSADENVAISDGDIALIKLSELLPSAAVPLALASTTEVAQLKPGAQLTVYGWGTTKVESGASTVLMSCATNLQDASTCGGIYQGSPLRPDMLCSIGLVSKSDACTGDSGGPLVLEPIASDKHGVPKLVGLVSWGIGCGEYPGVYANITYFSGWIKETAVPSSTQTTNAAVAGATLKKQKPKTKSAASAPTG